MPTANQHVNIHLHGLTIGNPGRGGCAASLHFADTVHNVYAARAHSTPDRMALEAVILALGELRAPARAVIHTDSKYVVNCIEERAFDEAVLPEFPLPEPASAMRPVPVTTRSNADLLLRLDAFRCQHNVRALWTKPDANDAEHLCAVDTARSGIPKLLGRSTEALPVADDHDNDGHYALPGVPGIEVCGAGVIENDRLIGHWLRLGRCGRPFFRFTPADASASTYGTTILSAVDSWRNALPRPYSLEHRDLRDLPVTEFEPRDLRGLPVIESRSETDAGNSPSTRATADAPPEPANVALEQSADPNQVTEPSLHELFDSDTADIARFTGTYRFLSNFFPSPITICGIDYPTVEHAYQAAKTLDEDERLHIAALPSPADAKRAGRKLDLRPDWEDTKLDIMENCLRAKFAPGLDLAARLLSTGNARLIEGNHWGDRYWGVCDGRGENHLGELLMRIREDL